MLSTNPVDLLIVNETKLKQHDDYYLKGYYSLDIKWKSGSIASTGTSIFYKSTLRVKNLKIVSEELCEFVTIDVRLEKTWIKIGGMYSKYLSKYPSLIKNFFADKHTSLSILLGDLNDKCSSFGCMGTNRDGFILKKLSKSFGFSVITSKTPNHYSPGGWDYLGLALVSLSALQLLEEPITINDIGSDHLPILYKLNVTPLKVTPTFIRCNLTPINWDHYRKSFAIYLNKFAPQLGDNFSGEDLEKSSNSLIGFIKSYLEIHSSKITSNSKKIPLTCKNVAVLLKKKQCIRNKLCRCVDFHDRSVLKNEMFAISQEIRRSTIAAKNKEWKAECNKLHKANPNFWKVFGKLSTSKSEEAIPKLLNQDRSPASLEEIYELYKYLRCLFSCSLHLGYVPSS
ncbi:uncharacterized protein LOC115227140 [Octopus sinensis]|uniref:Uncharacterized protein LOC115227140 n=1 Tax=Octopus sinensis TaxID=2607531 RepID=A0A6P7TVF8_9MOLL|nr:uncharacterized protein LOC115227140 [Octopus sinensis]